MVVGFSLGWRPVWPQVLWPHKCTRYEFHLIDLVLNPIIIWIVISIFIVLLLILSLDGEKSFIILNKILSKLYSNIKQNGLCLGLLPGIPNWVATRQVLKGLFKDKQIWTLFSYVALLFSKNYNPHHSRKLPDPYTGGAYRLTLGFRVPVINIDYKVYNASLLMILFFPCGSMQTNFQNFESGQVEKLLLYQY